MNKQHRLGLRVSWFMGHSGNEGSWLWGVLVMGGGVMVMRYPGGQDSQGRFDRNLCRERS